MIPQPGTGLPQIDLGILNQYLAADQITNFLHMLGIDDEDNIEDNDDLPSGYEYASEGDFDYNID
jgi:hypothetical protein